MTKYFISLPLYERSVQCNNIFTFSVQYDKVDDSKQYTQYKIFEVEVALNLYIF